eukprot:SAG11_NODE_233_length_11903_cov_4.983650_2_plen_198_part_00
MSDWDDDWEASTSVTGVTHSEWLVDYNCPSNGEVRSDGGGLPGYPVSTAIPGADGVMAPADLTPNLAFAGLGDGCADSPVGWVDSNGASCTVYAGSALCTDAGEPGTLNADGGNWDPAWGTALADLAVSDIDAASACCVCGGGLATAAGSAHITPGDPVDCECAMSFVFPCSFLHGLSVLRAVVQQAACQLFQSRVS